MEFDLEDEIGIEKKESKEGISYSLDADTSEQQIPQSRLNKSGSFKSLDYFIENSIILRHYIDFENFPDFINRWVIIKTKEEIGKEGSFVTELVAETLMGLVSYIEEVEGSYFASLDKVNIKSSKDFVDKKENQEKLSKKEALYGEHEIEWYLFRAKDGTPYLCANRDSGNEALYELDKNRKWKPVHNAPEFDGFGEADSIFESISFTYNGKKVVIK